MLFSIIVPTYQQEDFIEDTLCSIGSQQLEGDIEVIVIDGGCSIEVRNIVNRVANLNISLISERDKGQADAINKGMRAAKGDILCWLNSDDLLMPNSLAKVTTFLSKRPDVDIVYGDAILFNEERGNAQFHKAVEFDKHRFTYSDFIVQPASFWRRRAWEVTGEVDESLHFVMDWDWFLRASLLCKLAYIPSCLAMYRIHANHKTGSRRSERTIEVCELIRRYASPDVIAALDDLLPVASRLEACCNFLAKYRLIALRKLLFPGLYLKHDRKLIHDILGSIQ